MHKDYVEYEIKKTLKELGKIDNRIYSIEDVKKDKRLSYLYVGFLEWRIGRGCSSNDRIIRDAIRVVRDNE